MAAQYAQHNTQHYNNRNQNQNQNQNQNYPQQMPPTSATTTTTTTTTSNNHNNNGSSSSSSTRVVSNGFRGPIVNGRAPTAHPPTTTATTTTTNSRTPPAHGNGNGNATNGASQSRSQLRSSQTPPATTTNTTEDDQSDSDERRPSSAPGYKNRNSLSVVTSHENPGQDRARRPVKPLLIRSKSEYIMRQSQEETANSPDEEVHEWGARHGFEDHYQSDIVSQLANVCYILSVLCLCALRLTRPLPFIRYIPSSLASIVLPHECLISHAIRGLCSTNMSRTFCHFGVIPTISSWLI